MAAMSDVVVLITVSFPETLVKRLQAVSPRLKIRVHPAREITDLPEGSLDETEVLYTAGVLPDPESVPELRWIQFHYAGIDHVANHAIFKSEVQVTTLSGVAVPQMAEFALMSILALGRRLPLMMADSAQDRWAEGRFNRYQPVELRGSTVGIVGYGSIGREIARLCRAFGATVLVTKRDLRHLADEGYSLHGVGDMNADVPERLYPPEAVKSMVELCDFVVVTVPLTTETRGTISKKVLEGMKPTAYLIDISRGGVVDHGALVEALNAERLAGAALDVYPVEPLPEGSPLWEMKNVILSPHVAGASGKYLERAIELFAENLARYLAEKPLLNQFDTERGY
jgi:phosphoglycerate dehydrogenase-like enzyme